MVDVFSVRPVVIALRLAGYVTNTCLVPEPKLTAGTVVQNGDLLESAGDGTARVQADDICRSSTIAKVTSNYVSETYADGSFCVPCILMIG